MIRRIKAWFNYKFRREEVDFKLKELNMYGDKMDMTVQTSIAPLIAVEFVKFFRDNGGTNYVTFTVFDDAELEAYDITVQKRSRPDVAAVNTRMRNALHDIYDDPDNARVIASKALLELGYFDH